MKNVSGRHYKYASVDLNGEWLKGNSIQSTSMQSVVQKSPPNKVMHNLWMLYLKGRRGKPHTQNSITSILAQLVFVWTSEWHILYIYSVQDKCNKGESRCTYRLIERSRKDFNIHKSQWIQNGKKQQKSQLRKSSTSLLSNEAISLLFLLCQPTWTYKPRLTLQWWRFWQKRTF